MAEKEKGRPCGRPQAFAQPSLWLKIEPNRQLSDAVTTCVACRGLDQSESGTAGKRVASCVCRTRIQEIRVVQQIEEVRIESEAGPLVDLERLADAKIYIGEMRPRNRASTQVWVTPESAMVNSWVAQTIG